eukprot:TRINITY_DN108_c1_g2_i1.p1 TRINITY_DN108_c1_g2~~TRINITY_DN108_c1_g2_i1.p1  ORF type:complete len:1377 (+),score=442.89 TRINITY_DN108_c1_g2_i1:66-4133(+)
MYTALAAAAMLLLLLPRGADAVNDTNATDTDDDTAAGIDIGLLALFAFVGNVGVAVTGFGMAILYIFAWQIAVLSGYDSDFKFAIFIQALSLLAVQPLLLRKAQVWEHADRRMLKYFVPVTIVSTPCGQVLAEYVSSEWIQTIGGAVVTFVAIFEFYQQRTAIGERLGCGEEAEEKEDPSQTPLQVEIQPYTEPFAPERRFEDVYTAGEELGRGAFGVVKRCVVKGHPDKVFAVKEVDLTVCSAEDAARLREEVAILRTVSPHGAVVALQDYFEDGSTCYIVTEYVGGGDLQEELWQAGVLGEARCQRVCHEILTALMHLHEKKVVHCDIKLENILLTSRGAGAGAKLGDFGLAQRAVGPSGLTVMSGTPSYAAPEVLDEAAPGYGAPADLWSLGVVAYSLLAGRQPFTGTDDAALRRAVLSGEVAFTDRVWASVSDEAKAFVASLLQHEAGLRPTAAAAIAHPWFSASIVDPPPALELPEHPVFFMIGSQRSGSNWLRTMLDEREDLACPHPPHIMRDFLKNLEKFGDLSDAANFKILVDHVCLFVEKNQVAWTDVHDMSIVFPRGVIHARARAALDRVEAARAAPLEGGMYLLSVFDAVMNHHAAANGKKLWMCKSMGMSQHYELLLEFYGKKRLRFVYLVRDPRDVAMSFMKTPVGDCHYYAIATKWARLQRQAVQVMKEHPSLVLKVSYESILKNKKEVVAGVYDFIGERRFGGVLRQASVLNMKAAGDLIDNAKNGREASKAKGLSYQFQNLGKGEEFAKTQFAKWRHPETGLTDAEIQMVETCACAEMTFLGYEPALVTVTTEPTAYTKREVQEFDALNAAGIEKMLSDLKVENPEDAARRAVQESVLELPPTLVTEDEAAWDPSPQEGPRCRASDALLNERRHVSAALQSAIAPAGRRLVSGRATQGGYYPLVPGKPNQDTTKLEEVTVGGETVVWCSLHDGHGEEGHHAAGYAERSLPQYYAHGRAAGTAEDALAEAYKAVQDGLSSDDKVQTYEFSGTASVALLIHPDGRCVIANAGDSGLIVGTQPADGAAPSAALLNSPHTLHRIEERQRIEEAGGAVMTADARDELELLTPNVSPMPSPTANSDADDRQELPLRIWSSEAGAGKYPGCAFTRSLGDCLAHTLGVTHAPETSEYQLEDADRVFILASDGVTDHMRPEECVAIALKHDDPAAAAAAIVDAASQRWREVSEYMDDITAHVIFVDPPPFRLPPSAKFWTLLAGGLSGFLGGFCAIRGPPIILYFLHPPAPVAFTKKSQRGTGAAITFCNVVARIVTYLVLTFAFDKDAKFKGGDWPVYLSVFFASVIGVLLGAQLFELLADAKENMRIVLAVLLLVCGVSLLLTFAT